MNNYFLKEFSKIFVRVGNAFNSSWKHDQTFLFILSPLRNFRYKNSTIWEMVYDVQEIYVTMYIGLIRKAKNE